MTLYLAVHALSQTLLLVLISLYSLVICCLTFLFYGYFIPKLSNRYKTLLTAKYIETEFEHSLFIIQYIGEEGVFTLNDLDIRRQDPLKYFERV